MDAPADCAACRIAATDPNSGLYHTGCRACHVRQVARAPRHIREAAYALMAPEELAQFVADVRAEFARLQGVARTETVWARAGEEG